MNTKQQNIKQMLMNGSFGFMPVGAGALKKKSHFYLVKYFLLVAQQFMIKRNFFQTRFKFQNRIKR